MVEVADPEFAAPELRVPVDAAQQLVQRDHAHAYSPCNAGHVYAFEIENAQTVSIPAARHQREGVDHEARNDSNLFPSARSAIVGLSWLLKTFLVCPPIIPFASSSSILQKYSASSHMTLMMPNAIASPTPSIQAKYHMIFPFSKRYGRWREPLRP